MLPRPNFSPPKIFSYIIIIFDCHIRTKFCCFYLFSQSVSFPLAEWDSGRGGPTDVSNTGPTQRLSLLFFTNYSFDNFSFDFN